MVASLQIRSRGNERLEYTSGDARHCHQEPTPVSDPLEGWDWFGTEAGHEFPISSDDSQLEELSRAFRECFHSASGQAVLSHLRTITLDRFLGPMVADSVLRHLEGQRHLMAYILALSERKP